MRKVLLIGIVLTVAALTLAAFLLIRGAAVELQKEQPEFEHPPESTASDDNVEETVNREKNSSTSNVKEQEKSGQQDVSEQEKREQRGLERIKSKLKNQFVSLNFCETPFEECVEFLRDITGLNFTISEAIFDVNEMTILLRLRSVPLSKALEAICLTLGNLDYGLDVRDGTPTIFLSTPEEIAERQLKKPDSSRETPDLPPIRGKLPGTYWSFGLSEEEAREIRKVEQTLTNKIRVDQAATTFWELKDIIEKSSEIPITLSKSAERKLKDNLSIEHDTAEVSYSELLKKIEDALGLKYILSPDGVLLVSRATYAIISWHAKRQSPQYIQRVLESRIVTLSFSDDSLLNVISFLQDITGLNIVLSAAASENQEEPIALRVIDIRLDEALMQICDQVELTYEVRDSFILIKAPSEK